MLKGIRATTKQELVDCNYKYFNEVNEVPIVYHWKYKIDDVDKQTTSNSTATSARESALVDQLTQEVSQSVIPDADTSNYPSGSPDIAGGGDCKVGESPH